MLTLEVSNKIGALFNKLADAYALLSSDEKELLQDVIPLPEPLATSFFEHLEQGYCKGATLDLYSMSRFKEFQDQGWLEFCEEEGFDSRGELLSDKPI